MLVLIAIILALIPAIIIAYPFLRRGESSEWLDDESSPLATLQRRWEAALDGIRSAELEHAIGNLSEEDYRWLRRQYMREAAVVMRAMELEHAIGNLSEEDYRWLRRQYMRESAVVMRSMELEHEEEEALLTQIEVESRRIRERVLGDERAVE